jgi:hypothetical protein
LPTPPFRFATATFIAGDPTRTTPDTTSFNVKVVSFSLDRRRSWR